MPDYYNELDSKSEISYEFNLLVGITIADDTRLIAINAIKGLASKRT